jgi:hypothetical protein
MAGYDRGADLGKQRETERLRGFAVGQLTQKWETMKEEAEEYSTIFALRGALLHQLTL